MGHFINAILILVMAQIPAMSQGQTPEPPATPGTPATTQTSREPQATSPGQVVPDPQASPRPGSREEAGDLVRREIEEALGGRGGNRQMSPESERAIEQAVEGFLSDPEIKEAIAAKIRNFEMPGRAEMLTGLLIPLAFFALVALIGWFLYRRTQERMRARMEFHQQVLAKFTSGQEFAQFLSTPGSQQLLEGLWGSQTNPRGRLMKHIRLGSIFTILGLGLLGLALFQDDDFAFLAVLSLGLGIGFLVSAKVNYSLVEKMELARSDRTEDTSHLQP